MNQTELRVLSYEDVEALLPMRECIDTMADALAALARDEVHNPLRFIIRPPEAPGLLGLMPAYRGGANPGYGLKAVCVYPGNPARGLDAHQGGVLLFDAETGQLRALLNASAITAIRTAAVLSRRDASAGPRRQPGPGAPGLRRTSAVTSGGHALRPPVRARSSLEPPTGARATVRRGQPDPPFSDTRGGGVRRGRHPAR